MEKMETGYAVGPIIEEQPKGLWALMDSTWMLLLIVAMFGGDEFKEAIVKAVTDKAKEVVDRAEQFVSEAEKPASPEE